MGAETVKVLIHLPVSLKVKLDAMRAQGYTVSGYIQSVLERELNQGPDKARKGR
jgi:hypothetical protein